jgi:hypothetical protein
LLDGISVVDDGVERIGPAGSEPFAEVRKNESGSRLITGESATDDSKDSYQLPHKITIF